MFKQCLRSQALTYTSCFFKYGKIVIDNFIFNKLTSPHA